MWKKEKYLSYENGVETEKASMEISLRNRVGCVPQSRDWDWEMVC